MGQPIQFRRGNKENLPQLQTGEPGFVSDEGDLYVGTPQGNVLIGGTSVNEQLAQTMNYINDLPVNLKQFESYNTEVGYWDGAMKQALSQSSNILIPIGVYEFREQIILDKSNVLITGGADCFGGKTSLNFTDTSGIFIQTGQRYITIKNLTLTGTTINGSAIQFGDKTDGETPFDIHFVDFTSVYVYGFKEGITIGRNFNGLADGSILWNCTFNDMRIDHCIIGLLVEDGAGLNFGVAFNRIYFNRCDKSLKIKRMQAVFNDCNLGFTHLDAVNISDNSLINFNGTNFECDEIINEGVGNIFNIYHNTVSFRECLFVLTGSAETKVFGLYASTVSVTFENTQYKPKEGNLIVDFWSKSDVPNRLYCVKYLYGTHTLPKPSWGSYYFSNFIDQNTNQLPRRYSTSPLPYAEGETAYSMDSKLPQFYNGTKMLDFLGNELGQTFPIKLGNSMFIDGGTVDIPTGTGMVTVNYNHKKAGIFLLGPTIYDPNNPTKRFKVERNTDPMYFDKNDYAVLKAYEWDNANKTWSNNVTTPFTIQWFKISS